MTVAVAILLAGSADLLDFVLNLDVAVVFEVLIDFEVADTFEVVGSLEVLLEFDLLALGFDVEVDLETFASFDLGTFSVKFSSVLRLESYLDVLGGFIFDIVLKFGKNLGLTADFNVHNSLLLELALRLKSNFDVGFHLDLTGSDIRTVTLVSLGQAGDTGVRAIELLETRVLLSIEVAVAVLGAVGRGAVSGSMSLVSRILRSLGRVSARAVAAV